MNITTPVTPENLEILLFYSCPACKASVPVISPVQPTLARCAHCQQKFPIAPIDDKSLTFIKTMLANGKTSVNPNFL